VTDSSSRTATGRRTEKGTDTPVLGDGPVCLNYDEVEITPEMARVGIAIFRSYDVFDFFPGSFLEEIISEAYTEMARLDYARQH
jgi:hypothetical protein